MTFATKKDLHQYLLDHGYEQTSMGYIVPGIVLLQHGQYSRPTHHIRKYKDGWGLHIKHYYYAGTLNAPADSRIKNEWIAL